MSVIKTLKKIEKQRKLELVNILNKGADVDTICDRMEITEDLLAEYIAELHRDGLNISETSGTLWINKAAVPDYNKYSVDWKGQSLIRFGVISDTHLCSKHQQISFLNHLYDIFQSENIPDVYHSGDLLEGYYKDRPGHIQELIPGRIIADEQVEYAIEKYPYRTGVKTHFIDGNHDWTHLKMGGVCTGRLIARDREDMNYLGAGNAQINITPNCILELNHPLDGASYALSYSVQKYMDSMSGGEKPNILINGHHHKAMYLFYRNIHAFEAGTVEAQTNWMKGKRISAHVGGWIMEAHVDKHGTVTRIKSEFIPCYKTIAKDW